MPMNPKNSTKKKINEADKKKSIENDVPGGPKEARQPSRLPRILELNP